MSSAQKDIIYIDIDDEITGIIEKVQDAQHRIVALVLPKRAAVLQSVVNMKLLKRKADEAKKHIVLITSEAGLMPLAGAVGIHVAKTLQTKPAVPAAPEAYSLPPAVDEIESDSDDAAIDKSQPIGVLAGMSKKKSDDETIEVDNETPPEELAEPVKKPDGKKLKIPNFNKFRSRLFIAGAALVAVLVLWYVAAFVMPKAHIIVRTDTSDLNSEVTLTTDPEAEELDEDGGIVPAQVQEVKKTDTEKVAATGEEDKGTKATGVMTIRNCEDTQPRTLSSGVVFSGGGKQYVNTGQVNVPAGDFSNGGADCDSESVSFPVAAAANGDSYNQAATNYTTANAALQGSFEINGSAMTGGTSRIVKVVSQQDIDAARKKIEERAEADVTDEIAQALQEDGLFPLKESLIVGTPKFTASPKVGEEASEVTVTSEITYTMTGVSEENLKTLIRQSVDDQVNEATQMIQTTGLSNATVRVTDKESDGTARVTITTTVVVGPKLDVEVLKKEIAGKKRGETESFFKELPGVREVQVDYSPFWVFATPKQTDKITIDIQKAADEGS